MNKNSKIKFNKTKSKQNAQNNSLIEQKKGGNRIVLGK
jgi:hypothetical protein